MPVHRSVETGLTLSACHRTAACEKSVACSTCHVILEDDVYDKLEEPDDDENVRPGRGPLRRLKRRKWTDFPPSLAQDMLDLAFGLTDTYVLLPSDAHLAQRQALTQNAPQITARLPGQGDERFRRHDHHPAQRDPESASRRCV